MSEVTAHHGLFRNTKLHVDDTGGTGRPVVLIHGWPLAGESWSAQVDALHSAGYRVITYDRRGFGRSDKPVVGYTFEGLSDDLAALITELDLRDATLVGFSMGGGEVASYCARMGVARLRSVVFASSVTPYMLTTKDNPDGPLSKKQAAQMAASLTANQGAFYAQFVNEFFSVDGALQVSEEQRQDALAMCHQANKVAALACLSAFGSTDFREDVPKVTVPSLVIHGDADETVPFAGSGKRTHEALPDSRLHLIAGGPTVSTSATPMNSTTCCWPSSARTPLDQVSAPRITQWSMNDFGGGRVVGRCLRADPTVVVWPVGCVRRH